MLLLWYEFSRCVLSRDRQTVSVTAHQAQVPSSHSKGQCHLPSALCLETHVSRGWYTLADITCEEATPVQNRNTWDPLGDANHQLPFPRGIIHVRCFYLERTKGTIAVLSVAAKVIWSLNFIFFLKTQQTDEWQNKYQKFKILFKFMDHTTIDPNTHSWFSLCRQLCNQCLTDCVIA